MHIFSDMPYCVYSTWSGPAWSPALSLSSLLISIQSLMNEKPYHNEPGFEQVRPLLILSATFNVFLLSAVLGSGACRFWKVVKFKILRPVKSWNLT